MVKSPVFSRSEQRRTASAMLGSNSPPSPFKTAIPSTRYPSPSASASNASANPSSPISPRSIRAQALLSESVELIRRINPSGSPFSRS